MLLSSYHTIVSMPSPAEVNSSEDVRRYVITLSDSEDSVSDLPSDDHTRGATQVCS